MIDNPYESPNEDTSQCPSVTVADRLSSAGIAILFGFPVGGVATYATFGICVSIGSIVIEDETWDTHQGMMFLYGAVASLVPSMVAGLLIERHPIVATLGSQLIGVIIGAVVASCYFRWPIVMGSYFTAATVSPILLIFAKPPQK